MKWLERLADSDEQSNQTTLPYQAPPEIAQSYNPNQIDLSCYDIAPPKEIVEYFYPRLQRQAMGCQFEIFLAGIGRDQMIFAGEEALEEITRLDAQLSHYRDESDITRLNLHACEQWVRLEPQLYHLIKDCLRISSETEGAFDITAGPLVKIWGFYRGEGRIPTIDEICNTLAKVGFYRIMTDDEDQLIYFATEGMEISLGAVGKGYALDRAATILKMYGAENAVIHGGQSSIYAMGAPPDKMAWELIIKDPRDHETPIEVVYLKDEALSTSGNYEQYFEMNGKRYSHIIDPLTGQPTQGMISVSVIAPTGAESDALSTAFFVLGRERTEEICHTRPDLRVIMLEEDGSDSILVSRFGFNN